MKIGGQEKLNFIYFLGKVRVAFPCNYGNDIKEEIKWKKYVEIDVK